MAYSAKYPNWLHITKLSHRSRHPDEVLEGLNRQVDWANKWQMNFNVEKSVVMHIGHNNIQHNYTINSEPTTNSNRWTTRSGNHYNQRLQVTEINWEKLKAAIRVPGFIACNFNYKSTELMPLLYKSLAWPHLEFAVQFWSPHLRRDINKIEKIQRKLPKWSQSPRGLFDYDFNDRTWQIRLTKGS